MELKSGIRTTEFWLAAITNIVGAALIIFVGYNKLTQEEADLWNDLALAVLPLALAIIDAAYIQSRGKVKVGYQVNIASMVGDIVEIGEEDERTKI